MASSTNLSGADRRFVRCPRKKSLTSIFSLTELGGIIGLTREPAAEPVVGLQITDLPLSGHRGLQHAHEAHAYSRKWMIRGIVEPSCEGLRCWPTELSHRSLRRGSRSRTKQLH